MTLVILEGASRSGKSTIRDKLVQKNPEIVMWKGENLMRKGVGDDWVDYRERYHEALHRLYELNPQNIIMADRGFTDCVYNSSEQMRQEFRRLAACYGDPKILYFYPGNVRDGSPHAVTDDVDDSELHRVISHDTEGKEVLAERGTRDRPRLHEILNGYEDLLKMFDYEHINTDELDEEQATVKAHRQVKQWHTEKQESPDV